MKVDLLDITGKKIEQIDIDDKVFGLKSNPAIVAQAVRVYLTNQRQGNSSTKSRGEVKGSSKKIFRQKGTGRARQGTIRAPHRVGGGVALGPKPRNFTIEMSLKMRKKAMFHLLSQKLTDKQLLFVDGLENVKTKTQEAVKVLKNLKIDKEKVLFILPKKLDNFEKTIRNIANVSYQSVKLINVYQVISAEKVIFLKGSESQLL